MVTGCVMQVMQTPVNESTARVLTKAGCAVEAPREQVCCGALHAHVGGIEEAKDFARKNIEVFEQLEKEHGVLDAIIINAAGCGAALKEYPGLVQRRCAMGRARQSIQHQSAGCFRVPGAAAIQVTFGSIDCLFATKKQRHLRQMISCVKPFLIQPVPAQYKQSTLECKIAKQINSKPLIHSKLMHRPTDKTSNRKHAA
jgi:hypothetical protein